MHTSIQMADGKEIAIDEIQGQVQLAMKSAAETILYTTSRLCGFGYSDYSTSGIEPCTPCTVCVAAPANATLTQSGCSIGTDNRTCSYACNPNFTPAYTNGVITSCSATACEDGKTYSSTGSAPCSSCTSRSCTGDKWYTACTVKADSGLCQARTTCTDGTSFQTNTPGPTEDRTCQTCKQCTKPSNATDASTGCSGSTDRTCGFSCDAGYYKNGLGTGCTPCPTGSASSAGGTSIASCIVSGGYYIPSTATGNALNAPVVVPVNYYRAAGGAVGTVSSPQPTACPTGSGSTATGGQTIASCTVSAGYYISATNLNAPVIVLAGYYRAAGGAVGTVSSPPPAACDNGYWSAQGAASCRLWTDCSTPTGQYQTNTPSTTVNRTCGTCLTVETAGCTIGSHYLAGSCPNGNSTSTTYCTPCRTCEQAQPRYALTLGGCSGTQNRTCSYACASGFTSNYNNEGLLASCTCPPGRYINSGSNTCEPCRDCSGMENTSYWWNGVLVNANIRTSLTETATECQAGNNEYQNRICGTCPSIFVCNNTYREFYIYNHTRQEYIGDFAGGAVDSRPFTGTTAPYRWTYWRPDSSLVAVTHPSNPNATNLRFYSRANNRVTWTSDVNNFTKWTINPYYVSDSTKRGAHVTFTSNGEPYHLNNCKNGSDLQSYHNNNVITGCDIFSLIFIDTVASFGNWTPICIGNCPTFGQTYP